MGSRPTSTLGRLQPAVLAVAAVAAGLTLYYIRQAYHDPDSRREVPTGLHRSNAVHRSAAHRRRRLPRRPSSPPAPVPAHPDAGASSPAPGRPDGPDLFARDLIDLLHHYPDPLGEFRIGGPHAPDIPPETARATVPLTRIVPPADFFVSALRLGPRAGRAVHRAYQEQLLTAFLCRLQPGARVRDIENAAQALAHEGFPPRMAHRLISRFNEGLLDHLPQRQPAFDDQGLQQPERPPAAHGRDPPEDEENATEAEEEGVPDGREGEVQLYGDRLGLDEVMELLDGGSPLDGDSDTTDGAPGGRDDASSAEDGEDDAHKEGQSLLNLLYHIAEEQARHDGYVHRGVSCNRCSAHPIRGVRYRCANCVDFDLCEACEALQQHPRTHLFYKIRVPAPYLGNPRQPQPVWYPGRGAAQGLPHHLSRAQGRAFAQRSGFDAPEVDALWDQFRCLAAVDWPADPHGFGTAIDRDTFDRCFMPHGAARGRDAAPGGAAHLGAPPTLLIYDRMFTFYDTDGDGLIGFEEFVLGLAAMRGRDPGARARRVFHGYDHDRDGHVARKDFLLMFRAFYALTKELTHDMVAGMEDDLLEGGSLRDTVAGTQPVSAAYTGSIPYPAPGRAGEGKAPDAFGDAVVRDGRPAVLDEPLDAGDPDAIVAELSEYRALGKPPGALRRGSRSSSSAERDSSAVSDANEDDDEDGEDDEAPGPLGNAVRVPLPELTSPGPGLIRQRSLDVHAAAPPSRPARRDRALSEGATRASAPEAANGRPREAAGPETANGHPREVAGPSSPAEPTRFSLARWNTSRAAVLGRHMAEQHQRLAEAHERSLQDEQAQRAASEQRRRESAADRARRRAARAEGLAQRRERRAFYLDERDGPAAAAAGAGSPRMRSRSPPPVDLAGAPASGAWLRFPPAREADVGHELLYQITQEGLNELLDPLFKHREDLAVAARAARAERAACADDLARFAPPAMRHVCARQLRRALARWRQTGAGLGPTFRVRAKLQRLVAAAHTPFRPEHVQMLHDMCGVGLLTQVELEAKMREMNTGRGGAGAGTGGYAVPDDASQPSPTDGPAAQASPRLAAVEDEPRSPKDAPAEPRHLAELSVAAGGSPPCPPLEPGLTATAPALPAAAGASVLTNALLNTDLKSLLEAAGYAAPPGLASADDAPDPTAPAPPADPTLPQHRPDAGVAATTTTLADDDAAAATAKTDPELFHDGIRKRGPDGAWTPAYRDRLHYLALLDALEADDAARGGAGRLSYAEFAEIMNGPRGAQLGFLGSWVELVNF